MLKKFLLGLFFLAQLAPAQTYNLKECIEIAVAQNIQVKQAKVTLLQAESQVKTEKLGFLPTANASASHSYNFGRSIDRYSNEFVNSTIRNNFFSLNTGITLYNGLQRQSTLKARKYTEKAAEKGLENAQNQVAMQVAESFLQYMMASENLKMAQNQLTQTEAQVDRITKLFNAGSVDQGQVLSLKAQKANDKLNIVNAKNNVASAKMNLRLLMWLEETENFELRYTDSIQTQPLAINNLGAIYASAIENLPQINQAEEQMNAAEMTYKTSLGARAPNVSAFANLSSVYSANALEITNTTVTGSRPVGVVDGTGQIVSAPQLAFETKTTPFSDQLSDNFGQSLGFQVNVPIFNGNQVNNAILNSRTNYELSKLNLQSAKQQLKNEISLALNNANLAYEKYKAAKESSEAQKLSMDFAEKKYSAGVLNYFEYNNTRNLYFNTINSLQSAKYEYLFRKMMLEFYKDNTWKF